ncbi:MAG TPA: PAS domain-containing protein [Sphingomicrobium sp.]
MLSSENVADHQDTSRSESAAALRRMFTAVSAPLVVMAPDDPVFTIIDANDAYLRATMRRWEDLVGRSMFDAFPANPDQPGADGVPLLLASLKEALASKRPHVMDVVKYDIPVPSGGFDERWWSATNTPVIGPDGKVEAIIQHTQDVTDRFRAEQSLRQSEAMLRFLDELTQEVSRAGDADTIMAITTRLTAEHLGISNCAYADMDDDEDGFTIRGNWHAPGSPSIVGHYSLADFGTLAVQELGAGRPLIINDNLKEIAPEEAATFQAIGIGSTICMPLVKAGKLTALMAIHDKDPHYWSEYELALITEITQRSWAHVERVRAQARLIESEAQFHAITNSIDQMIWSTRPDGFHDYFNDRWYEFTGVPYGSTDGAGWNDIFHPDDQQRSFELWQHSLKTGDPYHIEYRLRHRSGEYRWVIGRAQPVRDEGGEIVRWYGTCTDIDELVRAREVLARSREDLEQLVVDRTEELERVHTELRQTQKMDAIGQLTGGIAHDFNNLLTPIIGALDLLSKKTDDERSLRLLEGALTSAERARVLVARLLSFARKQRLESRSVPVGRVLLGTTDLLERSLGPTIRLDLRLPSEDLWVLVDPNQLELGLLNLAVNARDAMPKGGRLLISAEREQVADGHASGLSPGEYVRIVVRDDGEGMDERTLSMAVEPFYSTKERGKGTGLGLSMVHGLAAQSGGALCLESKLGEGTSVNLWLPIGQGEAELEEAPELDPGDVVPLKILLVDDEDLVRAATADILADVGHTVHQAHSGQTAVAIFKSDPTYDLIVTDYAMPLMSGAGLIRELRHIRPGTPALLVTGYASAASDVPADVPRIEKPFRAAELVRKISGLTAMRQPARSA